MPTNVFFAEYRGYGSSTGVPQLARMLDDVEPILEATGVDPANVIAYGRSIGSIYAIHLASRVPTLGGLIIESGVASALERLLVRLEPSELGVTIDEMRVEHARLFDHEAKLRSFPGRTLVLHARRDHMVDLSHAERNAEWSGGQLVVFEDGDHNTIWNANGSAIIESISDFAQANLLASS